MWRVAVVCRGAPMTAADAFTRAAGVVARAHGWPPALVLDPRGRSARQARLLAVYLSHVGLGQPIKAVARAARLSPKGVRYAVQTVEDRRDDPRLDRRLDRMIGQIGRGR